MALLVELKKEFERIIKSQALGQAYVLWGQDVSGNFEFVKGLASFLENGDWQLIDRPLLDARFVDGATQQLGIEVARSFADFLYKKPAVSSRRVLCISSAAELTNEAQNSILKLVEEPPEHGLVVLVLRDLNSLLSPLRSRLAGIYVAAKHDGAEAKTEIEKRAKEVVEKVLMSSAADRSKIIKSLVDEDAETRDEIRGKPQAMHEGFIVEVFLRELLAELSKNPERNWRVIKELLKRQSAIEDFSTSKKLQIEAALQFLA
jgi:DNA polymerase III delta prime subunit